MTKNLPSVLASLAGMTLCCVIPLSIAVRAETPDQMQIRAYMKSTFETPEKPIRIEPVVISGDYALASWAQDKSGGRALLRRVEQKWKVVFCSGDAMKNPESLKAASVPAADAEKLTHDLAVAESSLEPGQRALFSLFQGTVEMDK